MVVSGNFGDASVNLNAGWDVDNKGQTSNLVEPDIQVQITFQMEYITLFALIDDKLRYDPT